MLCRSPIVLTLLRLRFQVACSIIFPNPAASCRRRTVDKYSELNLNQYSVGSPCRNVCTVCGSPPCPDLNLIHYITD
ncbi:hypothetical protein ELB75_04560 [Eikenella corrodens]|uniref:Uncharacterized protein n=1 Tax=Eikenella corrodens TaxID=539 RepID=A0A3S9SIP3_EIKCO|nr:hypothetical protein ELB75_04560 [Eikenella corrodens]